VQQVNLIQHQVILPLEQQMQLLHQQHQQQQLIHQQMLLIQQLQQQLLIKLCIDIKKNIKMELLQIKKIKINKYNLIQDQKKVFHFSLVKKSNYQNIVKLIKLIIN
jgi:hypothetical protein